MYCYQRMAEVYLFSLVNKLRCYKKNGNWKCADVSDLKRVGF